MFLLLDERGFLGEAFLAIVMGAEKWIVKTDEAPQVPLGLELGFWGLKLKTSYGASQIQFEAMVYQIFSSHML